MATVKAKATLEFKAAITLELNEAEAAALNEMTKYGIDQFLRGYRKQLGSSYIKPHEAGLGMLFETIDKSLPKQLDRIKRYREEIAEAEMKFRGLTPLEGITPDDAKWNFQGEDKS